MTLPSTHRVVLLQHFGGPDGFEVVERPMPVPGAGQVLVKVLAASVQFTDVIIRKGRYPDLKEKPPFVLGYDVVGEIVQVGPGVHRVAVGQRVADLTVTGGYAQYRLLEADRVTVVDPALDPAEAATLVLSWMTADQLLHRDAHAQKGQSLLVLGAAGAVGQALLVLGQLAGCAVWGSTRPRHAELVRSLGATYVDSDQVEFPRRFDVVFDGIGEEDFSRAWRGVGPRGHLSAFGFSAAVRRSASLAHVVLSLAKVWWWNTFSSPRTASFVSITAVRDKHPDWFLADLGTMLGLLERGEIKPRVGERIGLDAVADAHVRLERGGLEGKIVLIPNG